MNFILKVMSLCRRRLCFLHFLFASFSDGPNHWEATGISSSPPADVSWKAKAKKLNSFMELLVLKAMSE